MDKVIYIDGEVIIGYSDDIVKDLLEKENDEDEFTLELIAELDKLDSELVYIYYHPMGAYTCYKLEQGKELFVI